MGWVGGNLGTVYIVGICYFGAAAALFGLWLLNTKRAYLRSMLGYTVLSCAALAVCTTTLGFNFTLTTRLDGVIIVWLRWLYYALIYGLSGQEHYWQRWLTSLFFGAAFVGPAVASTSGDVDQRIVALCLSALPYVVGVFALWSLASNRRPHTVFVMSVFTVGVGLYALWFALGGSGFAAVSGYSFVWESATYLMLDAVLVTLLPALVCFVHCPCDDDKRNDSEAAVPLTAYAVNGYETAPPPANPYIGRQNLSVIGGDDL